MTFDQFIAVSAACGTALSAIATLLTVRQIAMQRQASYRPEIVLERKTFRLSRSEDQKDGPPDLWTTTCGETKESPKRSFQLDLINIGLGSAKSIKIFWSFDIKNMINEINTLAQKNFFNI
ncbi:MAG TPA: hypothetical protein VMU18_11110, partial [Rhodoblastus sp.]|nr:hypothetical protein [Rhodoblastus sp.]